MSQDNLDEVLKQLLNQESVKSALKDRDATAAQLQQLALSYLQRFSKTSPHDISATKEKHVMLSYSWGPQTPDGSFLYQNTMFMLYDYLIWNGVKVWMDRFDMGSDIVDGMASAFIMAANRSG